MDKRIKTIWLEALRSGEYAQGKGALVIENESPDEPDRFCCLGVLANLYVEETGDAEGAWFNRRSWGNCALEPSVVLTPKVKAWAGLEDPNPLMGKNRASGWNDDRNYHFPSIADLIERYL